MKHTGSGERPDHLARLAAQLGEVPAFPERRPVHREISDEERSREGETGRRKDVPLRTDSRCRAFIDIYAELTDNELRRYRRRHSERRGPRRQETT